MCIKGETIRRYWQTPTGQQAEQKVQAGEARSQDPGAAAHGSLTRQRQASVSDRKSSENANVLKHFTGLKTEANYSTGTLPTILTRLHEDADQMLQSAPQIFACAAFPLPGSAARSASQRCQNSPVLSLQEVLKKHRRFLMNSSSSAIRGIS